MLGMGQIYTQDSDASAKSIDRSRDVGRCVCSNLQPAAAVALHRSRMEADPTYSFIMESSLVEARPVKAEIDVRPILLQPTDHHYEIKPKLELIKEEPTHIEADSTCSYNTERSPDVTCAATQKIDVESTLLQTDLQYGKMEMKVEIIKEELPQFRNLENVQCAVYNKHCAPKVQLHVNDKIGTAQEAHEGVIQEKLNQNNSQRDHQCDICQKTFQCKYHLKRHMLTHTGQRDHQCEICKKLFNQKGSLQIHLLIHTGQRDYQCDICERSFNQKGHLRTHIHTHAGKRDHQCEICMKSFPRQNILKGHMLTHTDQYVYQCELCELVFQRKFYLTRHMLTHTGQRDHQCFLCKKTFNQKGTLKRHILTHTDQRGH